MEPRTDQQTGRRRILVVDGDAQIQRLLDVNLRAAGFDVQAVATATEGLAALAASAPDPIVSEIRFASGVDGFDFCRQVKLAKDVVPALPFLLLTEPSVEVKVRGAEAGIDDFLPKPLYVPEAVARVRALLQRREHDRLEALARGEDRFVGELDDLPLVDLLRSIEANRRSGVAHLAAPGGARGDVYFRDGGVVDAEVGRLSGLDALCRLFSWTDGAFEIEWKNIRRKDAVAMEPGALLMEALRRLDDWRRLLGELPPLDTVFEVDYHLLAERLAEIPDEVNSILRLFDGQRSLMRVIDDCGFSDLDALAVIGKLYREQIVRDSRLRPEATLTPGADVEGWIADAVGPFRGLPGRERRDLFGGTPEAPASVHARVTAPVEPLEDNARDVVAEERRERFTDRLIAEGSAAEGSAGEGSAAESAAPAGAWPAPEGAPSPVPASSSGPSSFSSGPIMAPETTRMGLGLAPPVPAPALRPKVDAKVDAPETTRMGMGLPPPPPSPSTSPGMPIVQSPIGPSPIGPPLVVPPPLRLADTQLGLAPAPMVPPSTMPPKINPETTQQGLGQATPLSTKPGFAAASAAPPPEPRAARAMSVDALGGPAWYEEPTSPKIVTDGVPKAVERPIPQPALELPPAPPSPSPLDAVAAAFVASAPIVDDEPLPALALPPLEPRSVAGEILARASTEMMDVARVTADQGGARRITDLGLGPERTAAAGELASAPSPSRAIEPPRKKIILDQDVPEEEEPRGPSRGLKLAFVALALAVPAVIAFVALKKTARHPRVAEGESAGDVVKPMPSAEKTPQPVAALDAQAPVAAADASAAPVAAAPASSSSRSHGSSSHKSPPEAPAPASPVVDERTADPKVARALPTEFQQLLGACRTAFGEKRAKDAEIACLAAKDANADSPEASALYAHALFNRKKKREAMQWAERALQLDANQAEAYVIIGGIKQANDDARGAKAAYKKYLELAPTGQYAADLRAIVDSLKIPRSMLVLGIETSCDETAASVVEDGRLVRSDVVASQILVHAEYGGVVPEVASRQHVATIAPVLRRAIADAGVSFDELDAIAVTCGPGLVGALLVGVETAKALAYALGKPLVGVNHLAGHLAAVFLEDDKPFATPGPPPFPHLALLVSGGHSALIRVDGPGKTKLLGSTRDDAAGEAFDKVAKMLGLGYPGGVVIDKLSTTGNPRAHVLPRALPGRDDIDFSFSGLKTAVSTLLASMPTPPDGPALADFCASFQAAVVDVLVRKSRRALALSGLKDLIVCGGVAANRGLRAGLAAAAAADAFRLYIPAPKRCTDNASMIAAAGSQMFLAGARSGIDLAVDPGLPLS